MRLKRLMVFAALAASLGGCERQPAVDPIAAPSAAPTTQAGAPDRLPFGAIRDAALAAAPGDILEVDLDEKDGRAVYEFKILSATGRVLEVEVDAVTGAILKLEQD
jgi:uncharacterized membrane protein YkoI